MRYRNIKRIFLQLPFQIRCTLVSVNELASVLLFGLHRHLLALLQPSYKHA